MKNNNTNRLLFILSFLTLGCGHVSNMTEKNFGNFIIDTAQTDYGKCLDCKSDDSLMLTINKDGTFRFNHSARFIYDTTGHWTETITEDGTSIINAYYSRGHEDQFKCSPNNVEIWSPTAPLDVYGDYMKKLSMKRVGN